MGIGIIQTGILKNYYDLYVQVGRKDRQNRFKDRKVQENIAIYRQKQMDILQLKIYF